MKKDIRQCQFRSITGWRGDSLCCPQAFGGDVYSGCSFKCWFCFCREMEAEMFQKYYTGWDRFLVRKCNVEDYKALFDKAFGSDKETTDWSIQCLREGLPFNMGSKSETFQYANDETLIKVLELFKEYKVPVIFETKSIYAGLKKYLDIIKDLHCAVIVSIMGGSDTLNYKLEPETPPASTRWAFVGELNRLGIWTGVRWEPIMPTINSTDDIFKSFAKNAKKYGAKHVSIFGYRSSDFYNAKDEFEKRGFNYIKMLEGSLDENLRPTTMKLFNYLKELNVPVSNPDFVNHPFDSDRISCCGTDDLFKPYKLNFQYCLHLIKTKGSVCWDDIEKIEFKEPKSFQRMKNSWNGGGQVFNLKDCVGIKILDKDKKGLNIYGSEKTIENKPKYEGLL
jgi:DNA repair photolyase